MRAGLWPVVAAGIVMILAPGDRGRPRSPAVGPREIVLYNRAGVKCARISATPAGGVIVLYNARGAPSITMAPTGDGARIVVTDGAGMGAVVLKAERRKGRVITREHP